MDFLTSLFQSSCHSSRRFIRREDSICLVLRYEIASSLSRLSLCSFFSFLIKWIQIILLRISSRSHRSLFHYSNDVRSLSCDSVSSTIRTLSWSLSLQIRIDTHLLTRRFFFSPRWIDEGQRKSPINQKKKSVRQRDVHVRDIVPSIVTKSNEICRTINQDNWIEICVSNWK